MRYRGKISDWKDDKGFGFITPEGGGRQVFVHINSFSQRRRRPRGNDKVTYRLASDAQGRPRAEGVAFAGFQPRSILAFGRGKRSLVLAAVFLAGIALAVHAGKAPRAVLGLYGIASFVTFVAYALDKSAAKHNHWRTRENTLHFFALVGGWPGAVAGQTLLRHKSKKESFRVVFWITVLLNCAILGWLLAHEDAAALRSFLQTI